MLQEILSIENELEKRNIDETIVSAASVKPFDEKYLLTSLRNTITYLF